jgi:hypothetical protein
MRKFLLRVVFFLIPAFCMLAVAEWYMRTIPNTYRMKNDWMLRNAHNVKTLLLGNSHGYFALVPSVMGDSIFNLCNVSQRLELDYFLLCHYADRYDSLKQVILVADNSNLFDVPMECDEPARVTYYQLYMGYRAHSMLSKYGFELSNMGYAHQKLKYHCQGQSVMCDSLGWGYNYVVTDRNPEDFLYKNVREHLFVNWEYTYRNRDYIDSIASWCQQNHVELVLLQTPVCKDYTRKAASWQLRLVKAMTDSCCAKYGARKFDYSCDERFHDIDFFDSDHLSDEGARKFSVILAHDLHILPQ